MSEEKNYLSWIWIYEKEFDNWGSVLNCSVDVEQLYKELTAIKNENGFAKVIIAKRRELVEKKPTHYTYQDTYEKKED